MSGAVRTITSAAVSPRRARTTSNPSRTRLYAEAARGAFVILDQRTFGTRVLSGKCRRNRLPALASCRRPPPAVRSMTWCTRYSESVTAAIIVAAAVEPLENA
jgi:hypothetical protein